MNNLPSLWPGEIASYDGVARTCRVRIPGITDGSSDLPEAVFNNPLGDRPTGDAKDQTEIRMLPGDAVWLMFEGGDARFPIIMGYRTPRAGNPVDWRRWHHANIEMTADGKFVINAAEFELNAPKSTINSQTTTVNASGGATLNSPTTQVNGALGVDSTANGGAGTVSMKGAMSTEGTLTNNGKAVGSTHTHSDPQGGHVGPPD